MKKLIDIVEQFSPEKSLLFLNWAMNIVVKRFPQEKQAEVKKFLKGSEGVKMLISNMERSLEEERLEIEARSEARGRAEGEAKKQREIAIVMIRKGLENTFIAEVTGLTMGQIDELRQIVAN